MRTPARRAAFLSVIISLLALPSACIPTTTATVGFTRREFTLDELAKVERVVEATGFHRIWFEPKNAPRTEHLQHEGVLLSWFESDQRGYMVRIARFDADGSVILYFSEFNSSFSAQARQLYEVLISGLENQFPASIVRDPKFSAKFNTAA